MRNCTSESARSYRWIVTSGIFLGVITGFNSLRAEQVVISEVHYHPSGADPEFVEIWNHSSTPLDMALWRLSGGVDYTFPDFDASNPSASYLKPDQRLVLTGVSPEEFRTAYGLASNVLIYGPWSGQLDNNGERISLEDKNGVPLCTVSYRDSFPWPVAADGTGHSLVLLDDNHGNDNWRAWGISSKLGGTPGTASILSPETSVPNPEVNLQEGIPIIDFGDTWKFFDANQDLGTVWRNFDYNDTAWKTGPGLLGFEDSALPSPGIQTPLFDDTTENNLITYYFRKEFDLQGNPASSTLEIDQIVDDGVVYYLNGIELQRIGLPSGEVNWKTTANRTTGNAALETSVVRITGGPLRAGRNVLAVELHQANAGSSDAVFGARVKLSVPAQSSVVINEILPGTSGSSFVEFFNPTASEIQLRDHYLSSDPENLTQYKIDRELLIAPQGLGTMDLQSSGLTFDGVLRLFLTAPDGRTVLYAISTSFPFDGRSLGQKPSGSGTWFLFADPTPRQANNSSAELAKDLHLNEWHYNADQGGMDWVEFYNSGTASLDLTGFRLATEPDLSDAVVLEGQVPAGQYLSPSLLLPLRGDRTRIFLADPAGQILFARSFDLHAERPFYALILDGTNEFSSRSEGSQNAANPPLTTPSIVLNEFMFDPPSNQVTREFIELFNRGNDPVDLSNWRLTEGINFTFPPGFKMNPGEYAVIAKDPEWMTKTYGSIPLLLGPFDGQMSNSGEWIRLEDAWGNLVDSVDYGSGGSWPNLADGDGSSMELRHPEMDNRYPSAWANSDESTRTSFQSYSYEDIFQQLNTQGSATDYKEIHLHLVGDSHVIIKNFQMQLNGAGANLLQNSDVLSNIGNSSRGWLAQGTHWASHFQGNEFHLISDGRGDNRPNRAELDATAMNQGNRYRFSFEARWVSGNPRLILQTWDHSIATSIALPVPEDLGTPGRPNSTLLATPAPTLANLLHHPPVPSPSDTTQVTVKVHFAGSPGSVQLYHRLDNNLGNGTWSQKSMSDDGATQGDVTAGDGIYSVQLPEYRSNNQIVQFYVEATSLEGNITQIPSDGRTRPAMYIVDTPETTGDLRTMRFVVSQYDVRAISDGDSVTQGEHSYRFPRLSNHYFNSTLIINETDIVYNSEIRNGGSPWTRGTDLSRGKYKFPEDRRFRNHVKYQFDNDAGNNGTRHHNRIIRYWLYLLGHPVNENEFIRMGVNGGGFALKEETEPVDNDYLDRNFENGSQGELYRIDDQWWFTDSWNRTPQDADWRYKGTDNAGRYRTEWMKRSREWEDDFTSLISFFQIITQNRFTESEINRLVDIESVMKMAAVRGYVYDWDSFTLNRGKNGYFYRKSTDGKFMFHHWDSDLAFGDASNPTFSSGRFGWSNLANPTYNRRLLKYYLSELIDSYASTDSTRLFAWLDAEEAASSQYTTDINQYRNWVRLRLSPARNFIGTSYNTPFSASTANPTTSDSSITINGTAPVRVFEVRLPLHPDASIRFLGETTWQASGVLLKEGENTIPVEGINQTGEVLFSTSVVVQKSGNALPVVQWRARPNSWNASITDVVQVDASNSFDPEGKALTFEWSITPDTASLTESRSGSSVDILFSNAGLYNLQLVVSDPEGNQTTVSHDIAVFEPGEFEAFSDSTLPAGWRTSNLVEALNSPTRNFFSLEDPDGWLSLRILGHRAFPLSDRESPRISFTLPDQWIFQSKVSLQTIQFGSFFAGIGVDLPANSPFLRYYFGLQNGDSLVVRAMSSNQTLQTLQTIPLSLGEVPLRIQREQSRLIFSYQTPDGTWTAMHEITGLNQAGTWSGFLTAGTDLPLSLKVGFDYVLNTELAPPTPLSNALRLSELLYHHPSENDLEFVELVNRGNQSIPLEGIRFTNGIDYVFGAETLDPQQRIVITRNRDIFRQFYPDSSIHLAQGQYTGRLSNEGETLTLVDAQGDFIFEFTYGTSSPWPKRADGLGSSLEWKENALDYRIPSAWQASLTVWGNPGGKSPVSPPPVVINEVLTHTDLPLEDAIELLNLSNQVVDISGWYLTDQYIDLQKFRIPDGTILGPGAYKVFYEKDFLSEATGTPFAISSLGDEIILTSHAQSTQPSLFVDETTIPASPNGISWGRYPNGLGEFHFLDLPSFGSQVQRGDSPEALTWFQQGNGGPNHSPRVGPVVIETIQYHPAPTGFEYLVLRNISQNPVDLFDPEHPENTWILSNGIHYSFPQGITLPAQGTVYISETDPEGLRQALSLSAQTVILGPYSGQLNNAGETLELLQPDTPQDNGSIPPVVPYLLVDKVSYSPHSPWPDQSSGTGNPINRRLLDWFGNDPANWTSEIEDELRDGDQDGLPDGWEIVHHLNPFDNQDFTNDSDGDGSNAWEEFVGGTDPNNPVSVLRLEPLVHQPGKFGFLAKINRSYEWQSRVRLETVPDSPWTKESEWQISATQWLTLTQPLETNLVPSVFYRIECKVTPSE